MNDKKFCWTLPSVISTILGAIMILSAVGGLFYYFGKEAKGGEFAAVANEKSVASLETITEKVDTLRIEQTKNQATTDEKFKNIDNALVEIKESIRQIKK
jgi:preprotein translocase subunit SecF